MQPESNDSSCNFIRQETTTPAQAVSLLIERFPMILDLGESREELTETGPFYAYERFASEAQKRVNDKNFLQLVAFFIDELAESKDPLLHELLIVSLLEKLAEDANIAAEVAQHLDEKARFLLREVEQKFYKRSD